MPVTTLLPPTPQSSPAISAAKLLMSCAPLPPPPATFEVALLTPPSSCKDTIAALGLAVSAAAGVNTQQQHAHTLSRSNPNASPSQHMLKALAQPRQHRPRISQLQPVRHMSLVQRFNTECLRRGVIGVVPSGRLAGRADYRFSRHHVDEQRRALRRVVEEKLPFIAEDPRYDVCVHLTRNLPLSSLLNEVRRLCASIEAEQGLAPPRSEANPPPARIRMQRFKDLLRRYGVADALEYFADSHKLRYRIYLALWETDPYFDLNEHEYIRLLDRVEFGLESALDEIYAILDLGRRAFPEDKFYAHYHDERGCGSSSGPSGAASPCTCNGLLPV